MDVPLTPLRDPITHKTTRPTVRSIARDLGIDKSTVSLALRNSPLLSPSTRIRVQEHAKSVGYQKDAIMAQLLSRMRAAAKPRLQGNLALLSFEPSDSAWTQYGCFRQWTLGAENHAHELGYATDRFNVAEYRVDRIVRIMKSRGIQGFIIIIGQPLGTEIDQSYDPLWEHFAFACVGRRLHRPRMHLACHDVYFGMERACEELSALGGKRIALAENARLDDMMSGLYTAGYRSACDRLGCPPIPTFDFGTRSKLEFFKWFNKYKPDSILTSWVGVKEWISESGLKVPDDVIMAHVDAGENPGWGGILQNHTAIGAAAVDLVLGQIHCQEFGLPLHPRALLIEGTWQADLQWNAASIR